ncbi:MAG: ABC transporter permease subunit [Planctomycetes bacterium]|nr:ABC transporter permease subunit [Planctomycetota bacterium]
MPVYDSSYRRLEGAKQARRPRFLPLMETGLRLFFRRRLPKLLALAALGPFGLMLVFICLPHLTPTFPFSKLPPEASLLLHLSGTSAYLYLAQLERFFLLLFAILAGGGLIANDLRANALEVYFSRPLTLLDYVLGKLSVLLVILLCLSFVPCLLLWITDVALAEEKGFLLEQLHLLPRLLAASLLVSLPYGLIMLGISALTRTARNAMLVAAGLFLMTSLFGMILPEALEEPLYQLVSINNSVQRLLALVLQPRADLVRSLSFFDEGVPLLDAPLLLPALVLLGWISASLFALFRAVKAVEVVQAA